METERKIVYIDNDRRCRNKVRITFTKGLIRCILCSTGNEGLKRIAVENPDVVLVDYLLPDMTGEEVYTRFLTDSRFRSMRNIPFIALTNNGKVDKSKLYNLGFSACLGKPFRSWELKDFVQDVILTHQLRMEEVRFWETIREAKDFLERVVESSADSIVTTNVKGVITYCNRASEELLGYSFEELIGKRVSHFFKGKFSELMNMANILKKRDKVHNYKTIVVSKDGKNVNINLSISKMRNGNGETVGALGISKKITGDKIEDYDDTKSERFSAFVETAVAVNHAINNPLVPILGNAQFLLQDERIVNEDVRRRLKIIVNNARKIHEVTQKLAMIKQPVTKEYLEGTRMLDIEASLEIH